MPNVCTHLTSESTQIIIISKLTAPLFKYSNKNKLEKMYLIPCLHLICTARTPLIVYNSKSRLQIEIPLIFVTYLKQRKDVQTFIKLCLQHVNE